MWISIYLISKPSCSKVSEDFSLLATPPLASNFNLVIPFFHLFTKHSRATIDFPIDESFFLIGGMYK